MQLSFLWRCHRFQWLCHSSFVSKRFLFLIVRLVGPVRSISLFTLCVACSFLSLLKSSSMYSTHLFLTASASNTTFPFLSLSATRLDSTWLELLAQDTSDGQRCTLLWVSGWTTTPRTMIVLTGRWSDGKRDGDLSNHPKEGNGEPPLYHLKYTHGLLPDLNSFENLSYNMKWKVAEKNPEKLIKVWPTEISAEFVKRRINVVLTEMGQRKLG